MDLAVQHALLATLQHEHRAGPVEHRDIVQDRFGPEEADIVESRRIVAVAGGEKPRQIYQLAALRLPRRRLHRIWQDIHSFSDR
jgi:hypothetical protein